jgi:hypothetical protein
MKIDAGFAISDMEVGRIFGPIYQVNAHDALEGFTIFKPC